MNKLIVIRTYYRYVICSVMVVSLNNSSFAQDELLDEQIESTAQFEWMPESELQTAISQNPLINEKSDLEIFASANGFVEIGFVKQEPKKVEGAPILPGTPDLPVNANSFYLLMLGLIYGLSKSRRVLKI